MDLTGKVAVITGAASGIGAALADRAVREGMRVVLADVEAGALAAVADRLRASRAEVLAVPTDVARSEDVEALRDAAVARFGGVQLLWNNAGVSLVGRAWEHSLADWEWLIGVNLWGVIHGARAFTPAMIASGDPGWIVSTASVFSFISPPGMALYNASKHAVATISETLQHDLDDIGAPIHVAILCPGPVETNIVASTRNRPAHLGGPDAVRRVMRASGIPAEEVAALAFEGLQAGRFYLLTHPEMNAAIQARTDAILAGGPPARG